MRARKVDEYSKTLDRRGIGKRSRCYGVRLLMAQKSSPGLIEVFSLRWRDMCHALAEMPRWERAFHIFWLLGPFVLLIERSPADIWLTLIAITFLVRSFIMGDGAWLRFAWVKAAFLFWAACLLSAALSPLPVYSIGETLVWFRFPLFAMAVVFWLGKDARVLYVMLLSIGLGMMMMCLILAAEISIVGLNSGRLSWPYGDLVPGNYLAKACLPAFVVAVALATSSKDRFAGVAAIIALISIVASVLTGERINFLIRACSGMLAAFVWKPRFYRVVAVVAIEAIAVLSAILTTPGLIQRFFEQFFQQLPTHGDSPYFKAMAPGWLAFKEAPIVGVGPGNLRFVCGDLTAGSNLYDCHPHPHNYYLQMLGEAGIVGLVTGVLFIGSIIWACAKPALRDRSNVVVATMWIVPFAFFWPIASTADFFGQWNNIFMWSAVAVALAGAQIGSQDQPGTKP